MKWQRRVKILAIFDGIISMTNIGIFAMMQSTLRRDREKILHLIGMIALFIQIIYAGVIASHDQHKEVHSCKNWMSVTIFTSIIYAICVVLLWGSTNFSGVGYALIMVFTFFKVYELGVMYAFLKEVELYEIPITSDAEPISTPEQSQVVSLATIQNTSALTPTATPQSEITLPHVVAVDLPPSYFTTQNLPECVEPPPPAYQEVMRSYKEN
ncbi:unnamed protein product [Orchesella dallaii]|uniref:Transmembrane protein n=1 Tax=Orchesella dallaii TaxID=48710 RepID=A0ABP1PZL8_9HEXA